jgi:group I intron endonuclease
MGFIYILTSPSGKPYVGQTILSIEKRFQKHRYKSNKCRAICNAIQKYGWENIVKHWYECPDEDLNDHEEVMVEVLGTLAPNGYNLREGGGANGRPSEESKQKMREAKLGKKHTIESKEKMRQSRLGKKHSDETIEKMKEAKLGKTHTDESRQKMSESHSGKTASEETKQKMSEAHQGEKNHFYGKTHTEESRQKMSESHSGKTASEETKEKMRESHIGKTASEETRQKISKAKLGQTHTAESRKKISEARSKKVYQYDMDGNFIRPFDSCGEAAKNIGKSDSPINKCARGKQSQAHGFKWSYEFVVAPSAVE